MTTEYMNQLAKMLKEALDSEKFKHYEQKSIMEKFASGVIEANQSWDENKRNSLNERQKQNIQNEQNFKVDKRKKRSIGNIFSKPKEEQKILSIDSPTVDVGYIDDEFVPIQLFEAKGLLDSRRASISSDASTFSSFKSDSFESDATARNISEKSFESFENKKSHSFVFENDVDDMLSSISSNDSDHNLRSLSSFITFSDTGSINLESNKSERSISIDSGISSLSKASNLSSSNESLFSTISQDITEDSEDEEFSINKSQFALIKKPSIQGKSIKLGRKVLSPTVPIFKSKSSDDNNSNLIFVIGENSDNILNLEKSVIEEVDSVKEILSNPGESLKADRLSNRFISLKDLVPLQEKVKEISRKDQLSFEIDKFIPQVSVSARKIVEERVKYGTLDMLKVNVNRLNLKIKTVDSLLKNRSLAKVDKSNNDKVLLVTGKDIPLLKELKRDLKKELHKVKQEQHEEIKGMQVREQQKQQKLRDEILKRDIRKIKGVISAAKSKVDLKERYDLLLHQLGKVQTLFSHNKKLHPDLKEAITELRKEKWASETNKWAIKPDDTTKNCLPKSRINLIFAEKKEIFSRKRNAAKSLLDDQQVRGEDKEVLKGLHKLYSNLAKSSEDKPKEKSNLEYAFKREFEHAYEGKCRTILSEVSASLLNVSSCKSLT